MKLVVIGAVAAGLSAAYAAKKNGQDMDITILEKGTDVSYGACGMPYYIGGVIKDREKLIAKNAKTIKNDGLDLRLRHEAVGVNFRKNVVLVKSLDENLPPYELEYDKLVIATGATAIEIFDISDKKGIFKLNTLEDADRIKSYMEENEVRSAVVVGAGYKGVEMLEAFYHKGIETHLVEMEETILNTFDSDVSQITIDYLKEKGINLHTGEMMKEARTEVREEAGGKEVCCVITNKGQYDADIVVLTAGVRPNTGFLVNSGLVMERGAIVTDRKGETNIPGVYAAGDCAMIYEHVIERDKYLPLGTNANKMGKIVGLAIAGVKRDFKGVQSSGYVKILDYEQAQTGITDTEAAKARMNYDSVFVRTRNKSGYYPDGKQMYVKLTYLKPKGKLIGAQIVGGTGTAIRMQALAVAVFAGLTVYELEYLDFGYSPPFNSVWDSINVAAGKAVKKLDSK